jgi:hypothetical protein
VVAYELGHLPAVDVGWGVAELLPEGLLEHPHVAVLAEDQRDHQPVVGRAHLAVGAVEAEEVASFPARDVGWRPRERRAGRSIVGGGMDDVVGREGRAPRDGPGRPADEHPVHHDVVVRLEVAGHDLVLDLHALRKNVRLSLVRDIRPGRLVDKCHEHVVAGMDLENAHGGSRAG